MDFKKSKDMLVLPIIFIILSIAATILMAFYLRKNDILVILAGISVPVVIFVLMTVDLIMLLLVPKIILSVDENNLYYKDYEIPLKDIDYTAVRSGFALNFYHQMLIAVLKDGTKIQIKHLADPHEASKNINKKYLHIKGNWVK